MLAGIGPYYYYLRIEQGRNVLRQLVLDPAERDLHADWDAATAGVVGGVPQIAGGEPGDLHLSAIVDDLCVRGERFRV
jgi:MmyB-like transcription regulator ligand binding domain